MWVPYYRLAINLILLNLPRWERWFSTVGFHWCQRECFIKPRMRVVIDWASTFNRMVRSINELPLACFRRIYQQVVSSKYTSHIFIHLLSLILLYLVFSKFYLQKLIWVMCFTSNFLRNLQILSSIVIVFPYK